MWPTDVELFLDAIFKPSGKQLLGFLLLLFVGALVVLAGYYVIYGHGPF